MTDVASTDRLDFPGRVGVFRVGPVPGESLWSLIYRVAARYGLDEKSLRSAWQWRNYPPRHKNSGVRADAEVVVNAAGRTVVAGMCGVGQDLLARAVPSWGKRDGRLPAGPAAAWRIAGAVAGPVAFGCRLCTARRTGMWVRVVRYAPRSLRVCVRHGRWLLDADADQPLEQLDLRAVPEVVAAQRSWTGVARRAVRAAVEPERVFALARAVVCWWWEQSHTWEQESIWPRRLHRLHRLAGGNAGGDLGWWRIVGRDAVVFPEVVAVADALLGPATAELVWRSSGAGQPPLPDAMLWRLLGERVGRQWLGPLAATDYGSPLVSWMGTVIRLRLGTNGPWCNDPWWVHYRHRPATCAAQLHAWGTKTAPGLATR